VERTGAGPTLVLVGGAFTDRSTVAGTAAALSGSYTAWTYDRRGRGATYRTVPGEDHGILRRPDVFAAEISRG
jgi:pimeloyl-ACP methyl ester carboxylesterase